MKFKLIKSILNLFIAIIGFGCGLGYKEGGNESAMAKLEKGELVRFILKLKETEELFRLCDFESDTITIVSDTSLFDVSELVVCSKELVSKKGKRSFNRPNDQSTRNELYVYRVDVANEVNRVYIMHPYTKYTVVYDVIQEKGELALKKYEIGRF